VDDILASLGARISASRVSVVWVESINCAGTVLVMISGVLDMVSAPMADKALAILVGGPEVTTVEVDVAAVTYIDMSGLRFLVCAHRHAVETSRPFRLLVGESGAVRRLLDFTQLEAGPTMGDPGPTRPHPN
jgi:anti-anti-sigma factor